jgi:hypothetical protein
MAEVGETLSHFYGDDRFIIGYPRKFVEHSGSKTVLVHYRWFEVIAMNCHCLLDSK